MTFGERRESPSELLLLVLVSETLLCCDVRRWGGEVDGGTFDLLASAFDDEVKGLGASVGDLGTEGRWFVVGRLNLVQREAFHGVQYRRFLRRGSRSERQTCVNRGVGDALAGWAAWNLAGRRIVLLCSESETWDTWTRRRARLLWRGDHWS